MPSSPRRQSFRNPDWVPVALTGYRSRYLPNEARDHWYDQLARRLADAEHVTVATLMLQGAEDYCDEPASSEGFAGYFTGGCKREVLAGVGHFPHREAPERVAAAVLAHLQASGIASGR